MLCDQTGNSLEGNWASQQFVENTHDDLRTEEKGVTGDNPHLSRFFIQE